jgi:hypothetical protein
MSGRAIDEAVAKLGEKLRIGMLVQNYGTVMHAQKPTPDYKEAIDELAYRYMPLTSN